MPLRPDQAGWRRCLGFCGKKFRSRNAGHRVCPKCARAKKNPPSSRMTPKTVWVDGASAPPPD